MKFFRRSVKAKWVPGILLALGLVVSAGVQARAEVESQLAAVKVVTGGDGKEAFQPAAEIKPGELLEYRLDYRNKGDESARGLEVTLPIPEGLEFVPDSARPRNPRASVDGTNFQPIPLKRRVRLPDGKEVEQLVPLAEYRFLRWSPTDLAAGQSAKYSSRMRVTGGVAALPQAAPR